VLYIYLLRLYMQMKKSLQKVFSRNEKFCFHTERIWHESWFTDYMVIWSIFLENVSFSHLFAPCNLLINLHCLQLSLVDGIWRPVKFRLVSLFTNYILCNDANKRDWFEWFKVIVNCNVQIIIDIKGIIHKRKWLVYIK
jgi:hypothetical protein